MRVEQIGLATLYLGDCREIAPTLGAVDCVVTSPPYNCGKDYGTYDDSLDLSAFTAFLQASLFAVPARCRVVNVGQYIGSRTSRVLFRDVLQEAAGVAPFDEVIWDKGPANGTAWGNFPNSPRIRAQHESIYAYGTAKMPNGNGIDWAEWARLTTSIWRVPASVDLRIHPAMMPVEIAARCIRLWSDTQGIVCDPFMGSGTTGVAAAQERRRFVGIELDPVHFGTACRRIEEAQRQGDMFRDAPVDVGAA